MKVNVRFSKNKADGPIIIYCYIFIMRAYLLAKKDFLWYICIQLFIYYKALL